MIEFRSELCYSGHRRTLISSQTLGNDRLTLNSFESELRGFVEKIVIPPGDELLQVVGNLGEMLTAAGARNGSAPAAVGIGGCGGPQPAVLAAVEWRCMTPGGGPLDVESQQRNTAVHRSIRFRFRPG